VRVALDLPERTTKPRPRGLTMVIDNGLPTGAFEDAMASTAPLVDVVKFGWGTSVVTHDIDRKIACLRANDIRFCFGGTLFEKYAAQGLVDDYLTLCREVGADVVEVSNGTIEMTNTEKASHVARVAAAGFRVASEVGFKDPGRSQRLSPKQWVDCINQDLDAGASIVITEARESGRSGIARPDGELRWGLIEDILSSGVDVDHLLFEAPNKDLQTHFVTRVGPNVNLGNIAPYDVIGLETLRLGLRSDTLEHFEALRQRKDGAAGA
jgi:phosphosulfolactate synthase